MEGDGQRLREGVQGHTVSWVVGLISFVTRHAVVRRRPTASRSTDACQAPPPHHVGVSAGREGSNDVADKQPHISGEGSAREGVPELLTDIRRLFTVGERETISCRFRYSLDDPFAVGIDLILEPGIHITWVVSRDLLFAGTKAPSGEGDFKVWPSRRHHSPRPYMYFSLDRPDGQATFEARLPEIRRWLESTYELVPPGSENDLLDWEALAAGLLGR
ncbi:SsgA family sporulation/cell division regulator [Streptomyces sp. NPDC001315]|uniref:SsgA family sporulation/cell division regulator n=1 Tax=Streptomyces sp. NPDC001315 TaxID=3364562 RepID=UPI00367AB094